MMYRNRWLLAALTTGAATGSAGVRADVVINEVLGNTAGADAEYVELYNAGDVAIDISGWTVELWDADAGTTGFGAADGASPYTVPAGTSVAAGAHFLFANGTAEAAFGVAADAALPANAIENSSYTLVLRDAAGEVLETYFLTDGDGGDVANIAGEMITADRSFSPDGTFVPPGFTRTSDGAPDFALLAFAVPDASQTPTAGGGGTAPPPTPDATTIMALQGAGHTSPLLGQRVEVSGVVTATDDNAFYLQDPVGDGDVATSDAVLVFTREAPTVSVGDAATVVGTVAEFFPGGEDTRNLSTTQLGDPAVTVTGAAELPAPVILGAAGRVPPTENIDDDAFGSFDPRTDGIDFLESVEAMRVTVPAPLAVAPTNRFGEIFTVGDHGGTATGLSERRTLNIAPDDFNPEKLQIDEDDGILPGFELPLVDAGATLDDVTGVVGYGFGNFEIHPTQPLRRRSFEHPARDDGAVRRRRHARRRDVQRAEPRPERRGRRHRRGGRPLRHRRRARRVEPRRARRRRAAGDPGRFGLRGRRHRVGGAHARRARRRHRRRGRAGVRHRRQRGARRQVRRRAARWQHPRRVPVRPGAHEPRGRADAPDRPRRSVHQRAEPLLRHAHPARRGLPVRWANGDGREQPLLVEGRQRAHPRHGAALRRASGGPRRERLGGRAPVAGRRGERLRGRQARGRSRGRRRGARGPERVRVRVPRSTRSCRRTSRTRRCCSSRTSATRSCSRATRSSSTTCSSARRSRRPWRSTSCTSTANSRKCRVAAATTTRCS